MSAWFSKRRKYMLLHDGSDIECDLDSDPRLRLDKGKLEAEISFKKHQRKWQSFQLVLDLLSRTLYLLAELLCLWIVMVTAWRTTIHPTAGVPTYYTKVLKCGNTTEEAKVNGCEFDLLSHNWIPAPCVDHEIMDQFREYVHSPDHREGGEWIPDEETLSNWTENHILTTQEEHLAHCGFLIRRIHRAMLGITEIDSIVSKYGHTEHCVEELLKKDKKPLDELPTGYWVGFSTCAIDIPLKEEM